MEQIRALLGSEADLLNNLVLLTISDVVHEVQFAESPNWRLVSGVIKEAETKDITPEGKRKASSLEGQLRHFLYYTGTKHNPETVFGQLAAITPSARFCRIQISPTTQDEIDSLSTYPKQPILAIRFFGDIEALINRMNGFEGGYGIPRELPNEIQIVQNTPKQLSEMLTFAQLEALLLTL